MLSKVLFSLTILLQLTSAQALTVISDLDDTIKITRVKHPDAIENSLRSTKTFLGMAELMRAFKASPENKLYIVSGSPNIINSRVSALLRENNIATDGVFLVNGSSKKPEVLQQLIEQAQDDVILLGDDQEHDPRFYESLRDAYPEKVKAIYIHQLNEHILPIGQIGYYTAYEVAAHELAAGRLTENLLHNVKSFITKSLFRFFYFMNKKASKELIPEWQECSVYSVRRVLSTTRELSFVDQDFLNLVEDIALKNCDD